jgi:hypothetical protein
MKKKIVEGNMTAIMREVRGIIGNRFYLKQRDYTIAWGYQERSAYDIIANGSVVGHAQQQELVSGDVWTTEIKLHTRLVYSALGIKLENPTLISPPSMPYEMKKPWGFYKADEFRSVDVSSWRNTMISPLDKFNGTGISPNTIEDVFVGFAEQFYTLSASDIGTKVITCIYDNEDAGFNIAEAYYEGNDEYAYVLQVSRWNNGELHGRYWTFEKAPSTPIIIDKVCDGFYEPCGSTSFTHKVDEEYRSSYVCDKCGIRSYIRRQ